MADIIAGACDDGSVNRSFEGDLGGPTACNGAACRRQGAVRIYDHPNEGVRVSDLTHAYVCSRRPEFHFCPLRGCSNQCRSLPAGEAGRRRWAANVRLAEPAHVAQLLLDHFDGLGPFEDLPRDGRCLSHDCF